MSAWRAGLVAERLGAMAESGDPALAGLDTYDLAVYVAMGTFVKAKGEPECFAGDGRIATRALCSRERVRKAKRHLEERGLIVFTRRRGKTKGWRMVLAADESPSASLGGIRGASLVPPSQAQGDLPPTEADDACQGGIRDVPPREAQVSGSPGRYYLDDRSGPTPPARGASGSPTDSAAEAEADGRPDLAALANRGAAALAHAFPDVDDAKGRAAMYLARAKDPTAIEDPGAYVVKAERNERSSMKARALDALAALAARRDAEVVTYHGDWGVSYTADLGDYARLVIEDVGHLALGGEVYDPEACTRMNAITPCVDDEGWLRAEPIDPATVIALLTTLKEITCTTTTTTH